MGSKWMRDQGAVYREAVSALRRKPSSREEMLHLVIPAEAACLR